MCMHALVCHRGGEGRPRLDGMGLQATRVGLSTGHAAPRPCHARAGDGTKGAPHLRLQWTILALVLLCVPLVTNVGAQGTLSGPTDNMLLWYKLNEGSGATAAVILKP
jgi:hypothetical protein